VFATSSLALALSPDGMTLASAGTDGTLRLSDTTTGRVTKQIKSVGFLLAYAAEGRVLYAAGHQIVREFDAANGEMRSEFEVLREAIARNGHRLFAPTQQIILSPNGRHLFVRPGVGGRGVFIWDLHAKIERLLPNSFKDLGGTVA